MNQKTLEKLKRNPHYKISSKQFDVQEPEDESKVVEFGKPPIHQTQLRRFPRRGKDE